MRRILFPLAWTFLLLICAFCLLSAEENTQTLLKTKLTSISLFKNGLGFVSRQAELPKGDVTVLMNGLPEVLHGTVWAYSSDGAEVRSLIALEREEVESKEAIDVPELLEANVGQTVELKTTDKETIKGKILSVPANRELPPSYSPERYQNPIQQSTVVLIETDNGVVALNKSDIRQITVAQASLKTMMNQKRKEGMLQLRAENSSGKGHVLLQYLTRGITWAPSCVIDIGDPATAHVSARAEIINELEDMDHVTVNLITGYPNLQFTDVIDPLALRGDLAAFLNNLANRSQVGYRGRPSVVLQQQAILSNVAPTEEALPGYAATPLEGQSQEELFFYEQKDVTLTKGERGYYPLYTMQVPYEHVYEWKIGNTLNEEERYNYNNQQQQQPLPAEVVWHSLRLSNTGGVPWTTSPAMVVQNGQVLGQDIVYYTSPGGKTLAKITQAVDVKAEQAEYESDRVRNAGKFFDSNYDLVTVKGSLKVTNFKNKDIVLTITKELSGEVAQSSPQAKVAQTAKGLKSVNPQNVLTWEVPVKAHDKMEIEYQYRVYIRG